eukprot:11191275-Lingulodinium_polyedra.AAC.1
MGVKTACNGRPREPRIVWNTRHESLEAAQHTTGGALLRKNGIGPPPAWTATSNADEGMADGRTAA